MSKTSKLYSELKQYLPELKAQIEDKTKKIKYDVLAMESIKSSGIDSPKSTTYKDLFLINSLFSLKTPQVIGQGEK